MKVQSDFVDLQWRYVPWLSKMTLTLDRMEGVDINEELKQKRIAELRCGRGSLAFLLYDFYGPIMIADLETLKNPLEEKILPRLRSEEHTSELQSRGHLVCRLLLEKKNIDRQHAAR